MFLCLLLVNVCMLSFTYLMVLLLHWDHFASVNNVADEHLMMIAKLSVPKAMNFNEIKNAAAKCLEMGQVRKSLINGLWSNCLPAYKAVMTELAEVEGVVMRGNRIVMPVSLRSVAMELAHEGHQGTSCYECQLVSAPSRPPPMSSTKMPDKPWEHIACDLLGPLPNGESILVVVDYYSRYFEEKSKRYLSNQAHMPDVSVGDEVLIRQNKADKLSATYNPESQQVVSQQGSEVIVQSKEVLRNAEMCRMSNH
ncbi:hypothetical protein EB796_018332 [Bugula neritina]|uniref:Uncharacterized protein n=1 Tax=Bugula neritina TaxID=10212 RepID=A0A7J7JAT8_BUGNE|nr:hypothetical protein EB796_018332 [Bugula neritina]